MHAAIINTVVPRTTRIDASNSANAKAPDDGRFRETLQPDVADEVPKASLPAPPATPCVGKIPVAMMRPPDVSSPEDAVARTATKAHEQQHSKSSQDTGAVSVAKDAAKKDTDESRAEPQQPAPDAASSIAALQPLPMPLPVATASVPADNSKSIPPDMKPLTGAAKSVTKKVETFTATAAAASTVVSPGAAAPQAAAIETKQNSLATGLFITPLHSHAAAASATVAKGTAAVESAPRSAAGANTQDLKTLVATPNALEVGVAGGTHGWLRVRAELGQMGEVTASIASSSASAADGLQKELPAISAYLSSERVGVSSLVVNSGENSSGMAGAGDQAGSRDQRHARKATAAFAPEDANGTEFSFMGVNLPAAVYSNGSGSWLSVRV